jgi:peptidoglycan/LPS O-acetylase OafA/YrhL
VNRLLRLYPTYLLALLLTAGALLLAHGSSDAEALLLPGAPDVSWLSLGANMLAILPGGSAILERAGTSPLLEIAWALRVEMRFYFFLFLLIAAGRYLGIPLRGLLVAASGALVLLYATLGSGFRGEALEYIPYFTFGIALYLAMTAEAAAELWAGALTALASLGLVAWHILGSTAIGHAAGFVRNLEAQLALFMAGVALWLALLFLPRLARDLPHSWVRADRFIGELTYPLYLTHVAAILLVTALWPAHGWGELLASMAASLAVAFVTPVTFEAWIGRLRADVRGFRLRSLGLETALPHPARPAVETG